MDYTAWPGSPRPHGGPGVVPALCAGFLTGTKGTGLLWAAALLVTAGLLGAVHVRGGRLRAAKAEAAVGYMLGACALLGGWWYVRNLVDTRNPVYPSRFGYRVARC